MGNGTSIGWMGWPAILAVLRGLFSTMDVSKNTTIR